MKEQIKLKVPSKPTAEFVSMGNFSAELKPKSVITVEDRKFANWLVNEYALAEVDSEAAASEKPKKARTAKNAAAPAAAQDPGANISSSEQASNDTDGGTE